MANSENGQTDFKWIFTMLLVVGCFAGTGAVVHYDNARVTAQIESSDRNMARLETAVHIVADSQGEKTRSMVDEALTISQNAAASSAELLGNMKTYLDSGDKVRASEVAYNAHELLLAAKENKTPVPPGYFSRTVALLNNLPATTDADISSRLLSARVALAEYHSALQSDPNLPTKEVALKIPSGASVTPEAMSGPAVYHVTQQLSLKPQTSLQAPGAVVDGSALPAGMDLLQIGSTSLAKNGDSVSGLTLSDVTQTLDGVEWKDVVFVNSTIRYRGGDLKLENVRFVNCTFQVPESNRGSQLADYATLESGTLNIG